MINGFHSLVWSDDAEATRAFFRDVLDWPSVDSGGGWLIFKTPPSELGIHPTGTHGEGPEVPRHELSLMCDDVVETLAELAAKGVEQVGEVEDQGFGLVASIRVPGAGTMQLYQPRHPTAYDL